MLDSHFVRARRRRLSSPASLFILLVLGLLLFLGVRSYRGPSSSSSSNSSRRKYFSSKDRKLGFAKYERIFFFGDSWTANGFEISSKQPDQSNPIGNPDFPGDCSSNGPNWVSFMTGTYNQTFVRSFDIAHGASTIDREIVSPLFKQTSTLTEQVENLFGGNYVGPLRAADWDASSTLFALWSGIVDISLFVRARNSTDLVPPVMKSYRHAIDKLYSYGARNFMLVNIPPMNRAPGNEDPMLSAHFVYDFNAAMMNMKNDFQAKHHDADVRLFDANRFFGRILDDPKDFPQITSMVRNFTDWCTGYNDLWGPTTPEWDTFVPECGVPVNAYFWLNTLHPGYAVHNATAYAMVRDCGGVNKGEFCL